VKSNRTNERLGLYNEPEDIGNETHAMVRTSSIPARSAMNHHIEQIAAIVDPGLNAGIMKYQLIATLVLVTLYAMLFGSLALVCVRKGIFA
jgi:hypothetical protein